MIQWRLVRDSYSLIILLQQVRQTCKNHIPLECRLAPTVIVYQFQKKINRPSQNLISFLPSLIDFIGGLTARRSKC